MPDLYRLKNGAPAPLPFSAKTSAGQLRTDLANHQESIVECGFVLAPPQPAFDTASQEVEWDSVGKAWAVYDLPPAPEPVPVYRPIDKVEAMQLIRTVTGMTPQQELAFRDDPNLVLFWRIWREDVSGTIRREHPLTAQILDAVQGAGHLTSEQRQVLLDNWPTA